MASDRDQCCGISRSVCVEGGLGSVGLVTRGICPVWFNDVQATIDHLDIIGAGMNQTNAPIDPMTTR